MTDKQRWQDKLGAVLAELIPQLIISLVCGTIAGWLFIGMGVLLVSIPFAILLGWAVTKLKT